MTEPYKATRRAAIKIARTVFHHGASEETINNICEIIEEDAVVINLVKAIKDENMEAAKDAVAEVEAEDPVVEDDESYEPGRPTASELRGLRG